MRLLASTNSTLVLHTGVPVLEYPGRSIKVGASIRIPRQVNNGGCQY